MFLFHGCIFHSQLSDKTAKIGPLKNFPLYNIFSFRAFYITVPLDMSHCTSLLSLPPVSPTCISLSVSIQRWSSPRHCWRGSLAPHPLRLRQRTSKVRGGHRQLSQPAGSERTSTCPRHRTGKQPWTHCQAPGGCYAKVYTYIVHKYSHEIYITYMHDVRCTIATFSCDDHYHNYINSPGKGYQTYIILWSCCRNVMEHVYMHVHVAACPTCVVHACTCSCMSYMHNFMQCIYMHTHMHTHTLTYTRIHTLYCAFRRQKELITPLLFEVAHSGNKDLLFKILENGDDVNPIVRESPSSNIHAIWSAPVIKWILYNTTILVFAEWVTWLAPPTCGRVRLHWPCYPAIGVWGPCYQETQNFQVDPLTCGGQRWPHSCCQVNYH